jgi:hypothetical protein
MKAPVSLSPAQLALTPSPDQAEEAYVRVRPELDDDEDDEPGRVTTNVILAVLIVLGALPHLEALRHEMEALPGQSPDLLAKLRDYAYALLHVHAMTLPSSEGETRLQALLAEGAPLRERLLSTAELYAKLGLLDAEPVAAIRKGTGYVDTANDLLALARLFRGHWSALEGKVPVTRDEVERAGTLGVDLLGLLAQRQAGTDGAGSPSAYDVAKGRLFRRLARAHSQARRAVVYLRWNEGDADQLVPSLFQGRPRRRRAVETPAEPPVPAPTAPEEPGDVLEA